MRSTDVALLFLWLCRGDCEECAPGGEGETGTSDTLEAEAAMA